MSRFLCVFLALALFAGASVSAKTNPPAPEEASPQLRKLLEQPGNPLALTRPESAEDWRKLNESISPGLKEQALEFAKRLGVAIKPGEINGVKVFDLVPARIAEENRGRILLNLHLGGYTLQPGEAGLAEAILMAGLCHIRVIEVDYRLAPEHPFPAALDDALAVYAALLKTRDHNQIGVFGSSAGGGLALALCMRAREEGLPMPGAVLAGAPWADLTKTGDTYYTNEGVDQIMVGYDGLLRAMAKAYANGKDPRDPWISPVYGDFRNFPPVLLAAGTRDLFVSNAVRAHQKLRAADIPADLLLLEGMSHIQYLHDPDMPETKFYFSEAGKFFNKYLAPGQ